MKFLSFLFEVSPRTESFVVSLELLCLNFGSGLLPKLALILLLETQNDAGLCSGILPANAR